MYAQGDREFVPSWHAAPPAIDDSGTRAWFDREFNLVVFVVRHREPTEIVEESGSGRGGFWPGEAIFAIGDAEVSVGRNDRDSIVIITPTGTATRFAGCLRPGEAERICKSLCNCEE